MTEPPRPPGAGDPGRTPPDPTAPLPSPGSYSMPGEAPSPGYGSTPGPPPTSGSGAYPPPTSGAGAYPPPTSGGGAYPPPTSGGGAYPPPPAPPTSGGGAYPPGGGYPPPTSGAGGYPPPTSGAGAYQSGTYQSGGGYPPGGPGQAGGGYYGAPAGGPVNSDDKTWALIAHFGGAIGAFISLGTLGFVGPLIAYFAKGQQSPTVRAHAAAALNFQIIWSIVAFVLAFVSWCLLFLPSLAVMVVQIIFGIIAGMRANEGQLYRYPMSGSFIK